MKISENPETLLPIGYLFLVVMGILKESVFYYQLGINILKYSSIMDILISPIATLTANPIILITVLILILILYGLPKLLATQTHRKWVQKAVSLKNKEAMSKEEISTHFNGIFIKLLASGLLSFFLGIGLGDGAKVKNKINTNTLEYGNKLNYTSGESEQVYLIGVNSVYYFYIANDNKAIKIVPINAIRNMELINNSKLK